MAKTMNFWEFLDRALSRLRVDHVAGAGIFLLTGVILYLSAVYPDLRKDELFRVLAQAVIVQGLVGLAMAAWFTKKNGSERVTDDKPVPVDTQPDDPEARDAGL